MNSPLRRISAVLFVVTAVLFVIAVNAEDGSHTEATTTTPAHDEPTENTEADHDEAAEGVAEEGHSESTDEEKVLGVDVESPALVALAVLVSLALAVGLWLRQLRWLALLAAAVGVVFAVFDVAEVVRQLDESNSGLAGLAVVIAAGHTAAAVTAGWTARVSARHAQRAWVSEPMR